MGESIKSKYKPSHPRKYKGDASNIICRSSWERKFCRWCDLNENILAWGSEEFCIPYISPIDNRVHRYFPDFLIKVKESTGKIKTYVVEVKPKIQTRPPRTPKRKTKKYINEVRNWAINDAKWKNAIEYCKDRNMEFIIITEDELGI